MEYSLTGIEVFQKAASGELSDVTDTRLQNDILTVQPGGRSDCKGNEQLGA